MKIMRLGKSPFLDKLTDELDPHLWQQEPQEDIQGAEDYEAERGSDPVGLLDRVISRIQSARKADAEIELASIEEDLLALRGLLGMEKPPVAEEPIERTPF
jgi:hypothetical protein